MTALETATPLPQRDTRRRKTSRVDVHVGERIRQRRLLLGMSQQRLAAGLGVSFQQVQKYEHGTNRVGAGVLFELARLLDVPVSYFFAAIAPTGDKTDRFRERHDLLVSDEGLDLIAAYFTIGDAKVRRRLYNLINAVAGRETVAPSTR